MCPPRTSSCPVFRSHKLPNYACPLLLSVHPSVSDPMFGYLGSTSSSPWGQFCHANVSIKDVSSLGNISKFSYLRYFLSTCIPCYCKALYFPPNPLYGLVMCLAPSLTRFPYRIIILPKSQKDEHSLAISVEGGTPYFFR